MNMKLALPAILMAGGAIGFGLPAADEGQAGGAAASAQAGQIENEWSNAATASANSLSVDEAEREDGDAPGEQLTIKRHRDGHFYADVEIEGVTSRMLVDTGASVIALTGEDAAAMGLQWDESRVAPVARGANGPVYGVETSLPQVAAGGFEARDVRAVIVPEGLEVSLLGQSFLSTIGRVEIAGDRLLLRSGA